MAAFHIFFLFYRNFEVFALFCAWYGVLLGVSTNHTALIHCDAFYDGLPYHNKDVCHDAYKPKAHHVLDKVR